MRLSRKNCYVMALLVALPISLSHAQFLDPGSNIQMWDRSAAILSSRSVDTTSLVKQLSHSDALKDGATTVQALTSLSLREDWPLPSREAAIYEFTRNLATHSSNAVDPDILEYLSAYQPQVLVESEHGSGQPLFNVRAAAAGVENGWLRDDSAQQALASLDRDPHTWLDMYINAQHPAQRSGYLDALKLADANTLWATQAEALQKLQSNSDLTAVIALTVSITRDFDAARQLLLHGQGAQLAPALTKLSFVASTDELVSLLAFAIAETPTGNAALAIASWAPLLSTHQDTRQLLLSTLQDPELGSAAAIALANRPDIQTIRELQLLTSGEGLSAQRATMALEINRQELIQEQRK